MAGVLQDRVAVITGSGTGIGRATALAMAKEGAKIVTNNRRPGSPGGDAETSARQIIAMGGQAIPFFGDVSDFNTAEELIQTAISNFGRIDILVNNAGGNFPHMVWNMTEAEWDGCVDSHLKGAFNCIRHASGYMRQQKWGRILNATSWDRLGAVGNCNYCAAMAGVIGLSRAVALELGRYGVTSNVYSPMAVTELREAAYAGVKKRYEMGFLPKYRWDEFQKALGPESISPLLVYLCTDEAANINGQVFHLEKGRVGIYSEPIEVRAIFNQGELWSVEQLVELVPKTLLVGYTNPAPPEPPERKQTK